MKQYSDGQIEKFLLLLRAAVHGQPLFAHAPEKQSLNLDAQQWEEIVSLAKAHNIFPLVFEKASEDSSFVQLLEYPIYLMGTMQMVAMQVQRTKELLKLCQAFYEAGYPALVMKGLICRLLYGELCDHRPSADEDILIRMQDFESVRQIMMRQGFVQEKEVTPEELKKIQEVHFRSKTGFVVELHVNPIGYGNDWRGQLNDCFVDVFQRYRETEVDGVVVRTMSHTDHLLFLILHALKHFSASGVGIRQVLDVLLYIRQFGAECDWDYLYKTVEKMDGLLFLSDLIHIGNQYLGFDLEPPLAPNCPDELLEEILGCGAFGNATSIQQTASSMTSAVMARRLEEHSIGWKIILKTAFPGRERMCSNYPELKAKPWLLPVCWVRRWLRFLRRNKGEDVEKLVPESIKASRRRIALLKKYGVL